MLYEVITVPEGVGGLAKQVADPRFSTGVGLVLHAALGATSDAGTRDRVTHSDRRAPFDFRRILDQLF